MSWKPSERRSSVPPPSPQGQGSGSRPRVTTVSLEAIRVLEGYELDPTLVPGARTIVEDVLCIRHGEEVTLLCDVGEEALGRAVLAVLREIGANPSVYLLVAALPESEGLAQRIAGTLATAAAAIYVFADMPRPGSPRSRWLEAGRGRRQALLAGVSPTVARQSLRAPRADLERLGLRVADRLAGASRIEIRTSMGTALEVRPAPGVRPIVEAGGIGTDVSVPVFPTGEVRIPCAGLEGSVLADGGVWLDARTPLGLASRLSLRFEDGRLVDAKGPEAERLLAHLESERLPRSVSCMAIGTNPNVLTPIRELVQDARMPGVRLLLGRGRDVDDALAPAVHVLIRRPDVRAGAHTLLVNGRFARELLA